MLRKKIATIGNSAALVLSKDMLALMGVEVGDEVEISMVDQLMVVRPVPTAAKKRKTEKAIDEVFRRRHELFKRLAAGAE